MGRQLCLEVCEHGKWIALPPVHDTSYLAVAVCDANYLAVSTVHTLRLGKTGAKRLGADPRRGRNCRHISTVLAGMAATTQPLSWLTQQPWQQIPYILSSWLTRRTQPRSSSNQGFGGEAHPCAPHKSPQPSKHLVTRLRSATNELSC